MKTLLQCINESSNITKNDIADLEWMLEIAWDGALISKENEELESRIRKLIEKLKRLVK